MPNTPKLPPRQLADDIKASITELANGATYPDLIAAVDELAEAAIAASAPATAPEPVRYGCHCGLGQGEEPDSCVIDEGRPQDCTRSRRGGVTAKEQCSEWRPITVSAAPATAPTVETMLAQMGEIAAESRANIGKPVKLPALVSDEARKFMRGEPSLFDQIPAAPGKDTL